MAEQAVAPEVKVETPVVPEVKPEPIVVKEDLISRVSKVVVEAPKPKEETNPFGLTKEDYDKVQTDPTLSKFYKSMQSDYIRKTQEASELKKQAEQTLKQSQTWTTERLQQEINKPDFIQAAQQITANNNPPNSGLSDQEYSALTDKEKAQLSNMQQQLQSMQMQNWQMQQKQQDEQLKARYANYAPDIVDTTIKQLVKGEIRADREVVWKALDYEAAVNRAYELGKQDRLMDNKEKQQALSPEGYSATPSNDVPKAEANESNNAYFKRLAQRRLAESVRQTR
jgi:hypothetical protein